MKKSQLFFHIGESRLEFSYMKPPNNILYEKRSQLFFHIGESRWEFSYMKPPKHVVHIGESRWGFSYMKETMIYKNKFEHSQGLRMFEFMFINHFLEFPKILLYEKKSWLFFSYRRIHTWILLYEKKSWLLFRHFDIVLAYKRQKRSQLVFFISENPRVDSPI